MDFKKIFSDVFKSISWKPIVSAIYFDGLRPQLVKLVESTDTKLDDFALEAADYLANRFLKEDDKAEEIKANMKAIEA